MRRRPCAGDAPARQHRGRTGSLLEEGTDGMALHNRPVRRRTCLLAALAWPALPTRAADGARAPAAALVAELVEDFMARAEGTFRVNASARLDADLRRQGEALARDHLQRLPPLLRAWVEEEFEVQGGTATIDTVAWCLLARWANAMARWSLYSAGDEHDRAWWTALTAPQVCDTGWSISYFTIALRLLQRVQGPTRQTLLDGLHESLSRWTSAQWPPPPERPALDLQALAAQAIDDLRAGRRAPETMPMPPVLAASVFVPAGAHPMLDDWLLDCAQAGWAARSLVAADAAPTPEQVLALRYATMLRAEHTLPSFKDDEPPPEPTAYPALARRWGVTGDVTVETDVDAAGQVQRTRVVARRISVPGVRDARPVAFETMLDAPALAAAARRKPVRPAGQVEGAPYSARTTFTYRFSE